MRYALSDAEWRLIEPILPCKPRVRLLVQAREVRGHGRDGDPRKRISAVMLSTRGISEHSAA